MFVKQPGGDVGNDDLAEAGAQNLLRVVGLQGRHAGLLDACDLGVGGRPGEVDVALMRGFGVTCSARARRQTRVGRCAHCLGLRW